MEKGRTAKGIRFPLNKIKFGREIAAINGDYNFKTYPKTAGFFHGYSFGYVRNGFTHEFIGSLNERSGWTILNFDFNKNLITLEKDVEGKTIKGDFTLLTSRFSTEVTTRFSTLISKLWTFQNAA